MDFIRIFTVNYTYMNSTKIRKEISLDQEIINRLKEKAQKDGRNLKNYMEKVLIDDANDFEITPEYEEMMNELLEKRARGELKFISEDEFKSRIRRK